MNHLVLVQTRPDGEGLVRLQFDEPAPRHQRPGQFLQVGIGQQRPIFLAIASLPGEPLVLLVKAQGDTALALAAALPGDLVEISDAQGQGFALERALGRPVVVLVNGSGISAARPVVETLVRAGRVADLHVLYGVFTPAHLSFSEDLDRWRALGVDLEVVLGMPPVGWTGPAGFVQERARDKGLARADVAVVLVGVPAMIEDARRIFGEAGVPGERILVNF